MSSAIAKLVLAERGAKAYLWVMPFFATTTGRIS